MLLCVACVSHLDGKIHEETVNLKIVSAHIENYEVFIKKSEKYIKLTPNLDVYSFNTPELRIQKPVVFGIELSERIWDIPKFLIVKTKNNIIETLSCHEVLDLAKDKNGFSILKI